MKSRQACRPPGPSACGPERTERGFVHTRAQCAPSAGPLPPAHFLMPVTPKKQTPAGHGCKCPQQAAEGVVCSTAHAQTSPGPSTTIVPVLPGDLSVCPSPKHWEPNVRPHLFSGCWAGRSHVCGTRGSVAASQRHSQLLGHWFHHRFRFAFLYFLICFSLKTFFRVVLGSHQN